MKRTAIAAVLGSTLAVLAAGSAFTQVIDDAGTRLPVRSTFADQHRVEASGSAVTAFPGAADEAGVRLPSAGTYADQHRAGKSADMAFPQTVDEAGVQLPPMPASLEADEATAN